jgi:glucose dehydrogenase
MDRENLEPVRRAISEKLKQCRKYSNRLLIPIATFIAVVGKIGGSNLYLMTGIAAALSSVIFTNDPNIAIDLMGLAFMRSKVRKALIVFDLILSWYNMTRYVPLYKEVSVGLMWLSFL